MKSPSIIARNAFHGGVSRSNPRSACRISWEGNGLDRVEKKMEKTREWWNEKERDRLAAGSRETFKVNEFSLGVYIYIYPNVGILHFPFSARR